MGCSPYSQGSLYVLTSNCLVQNDPAKDAQRIFLYPKLAVSWRAEIRVWMWQLPRNSTQTVMSHSSLMFGFSHGCLNCCFHLTLQLPAGSVAALRQSLQKKLQLWETWLYPEVPLSGSCKYVQPPPKLLPETGTGLLVGCWLNCARHPKCWISDRGGTGCLCRVGITHAFRDPTVTERRGRAMLGNDSWTLVTGGLQSLGKPRWAEVLQALLLVVQPLTYSAGFPIPNAFLPQRSHN